MGRALLAVLPALIGCAAAEPSVAVPVVAGDGQLEAEMRQLPIAMYMARWCPVCQRASAWLRDGGYRFVEHDVESDARAAAVLATVNPRGTVPMFEIDGQVVVGFDAKLIRFVLARAVARRAGSTGDRVATQ
jgi:glutaredoxin